MFKKVIFLVAISVFLFSGSQALAQIDGNKWWDFEKWVVDISINKDSTFIVRETQTFNFHGNYHWAKRDIAKNKVRAITDVKVFDSSGKELSYPEVEITGDAAQVSVKLNFDLTDTQATWTFEYKVIGGLGYFEDHDELYWNAVSSERNVPIKDVEVLVHLPEMAAKEEMRQALYEGPYGSTIPLKTYQIIDGRTFKFWGNDIGPYENFTIVAGWPRGLIYEPSILKINSEPSAKVIIDDKRSNFSTPVVLEENYEIKGGEHKISVSKFGWKIKGDKERIINVGSGAIHAINFELEKSLWYVILNRMVYLIPVLLAVFLWRKYKSIPKIQKTIIAQYEPPEDLSPAEVAGLVYGVVRPKDFTATLVDLAYRGYLKIVEREEKILWGQAKKYALLKRKEFLNDSSLLAHEKDFLEAIFGQSDTEVEINDLQDKSRFRKAMTKMPKEVIKKIVKEREYFSKTPLPRVSSCLMGVILVFLGFVLEPFVVSLSGSFSLGAAFEISLFLLVIYILIKPRPLTEKGVEAKWHALGFKKYLQVAERFRLGVCTPETFEKYLSYAMVFGVEQRWAARFADIYKNQPDWYESGRPITGFNSVVFAGALSSMASSVNMAISYSSPSGSSGFGGGGGGGISGGGGGGGGSSAG